MNSDSRNGWFLRSIPIVCVLAILHFRTHEFLAWDTLPARGDPSLPFQGTDLTSQFAVWVRIAIQGLKDQKIIPFWNPFTHAGTPLFELPQTGVFSLSALLGFFMPFELALKSSMLLHLALGTIGTYFCCIFLLSLSPVFSAVGALVFGLSPFFLDHFRVGHLNQIYPMALMPWVFFTFWRSLWNGADYRDRLFSGYRWAILTGILIGIQLLEGADNILLYEIISFLLIFSTIFSVPHASRSLYLTRISLFGALTAISAFACSAFQLLPMIAYLPTTGRTGGLPWEFASAQIREVLHSYPGPLSFVLGVLGLKFIFEKKRSLALWWGGILIFGVCVATIPFLFKILWLYMPGFSYQRIPNRALVLSSVILPLLVAAGVQGVWDRLKTKVSASRFWMALLIFGLVFEVWFLAPQLPPMASVHKEIESNAAMQWLSQNAKSDRIHIWETRDRHWGTEHVTVPLGLRVIAGYTSSESQDYFPFDFLPESQRTFFGEAYQQPAKLFGLLNVRYLLASQPLTEPGFHLAQRVPSCPIEICQPAKSAGTWIYENKKALPPAYQVPHAIAVVGKDRPNFETALDILKMPEFDPANTVLIQVDPHRSLPKVDLMITSKGTSISGVQSWETNEGRERVRRLLSEVNWTSSRVLSAMREADLSRPNLNEIHVNAPGKGWLVVSERIGLFPGWSASFEQKNLPIYRANGVLGALQLEKSGPVELKYEPHGFRWGVWILIGASLLWVILELCVAHEGYRRGSRTVRSQKRGAFL